MHFSCFCLIIWCFENISLSMSTNILGLLKLVKLERKSPRKNINVGITAEDEFRTI
jgi:hypothetical protein